CGRQGRTARSWRRRYGPPRSVVRDPGERLDLALQDGRCRAWEDPDVAEPNTPSSGSRDDGADPEDGPTGRVARTRERVERTRGQVADVAERVVAARPDTPLIDTAFEIHERDSRIAGGMLAGAIAFRLFLLLVPLLLILVAGLGFLHLSDAERATSQQLDLSEALVSTMQTVGENAARGRWITLW